MICIIRSHTLLLTIGQIPKVHKYELVAQSYTIEEFVAQVDFLFFMATI